MDTALDRAQGLLEHIRDFVVFEPVKIQQERVAEDLRQLVNGGLDILYPQVAFHGSRNCHLSGVQQELVGSTVKDGILLGFTAVIIDKNITHDGI